MAQKKESAFFQNVYQVVSRIPSGKVVSYGQIAAFLGKPRSGRTVGWAMHGSPQGIPWHRVIMKSGKLPLEGTCFGYTNQRELLTKEGVTFLQNGYVDIKSHLWQIKIHK